MNTSPSDVPLQPRDVSDWMVTCVREHMTTLLHAKVLMCFCIMMHCLREPTCLFQADQHTDCVPRGTHWLTMMNAGTAVSMAPLFLRSMGRCDGVGGVETRAHALQRHSRRK